MLWFPARCGAWRCGRRGDGGSQGQAGPGRDSGSRRAARRAQRRWVQPEVRTAARGGVAVPLSPYLPGARGDGETCGKRENPAPLPRGNRVALKAAKRRSLESGSEAAGSHPHRGESEPGGREAVGARLRETASKPLPSEAPRGVSKLPGAWGALKGSQGIPHAQDWALQRGKRRRLRDRAGGV